MPPAPPLSSETRQSAVDLLWKNRPCPSSADKFRRCLFFVQTGQTGRPAALPRCIMPPFSTANRKDTQ